MKTRADIFILDQEHLTIEQQAVIDDINRQYGSVSSFNKQLSYKIIDRANDPTFNEIYSLYQTYFPLAEERESFEGFQKVMDFNHSHYQDIFGPFREEWIAVYSPNNQLLASINFSYYFISNEMGDFVTIHIVYLFVHHLYRSLGLASNILNRAYSHVKIWIESESLLNVQDRIYIFCEQNSPEMMTEDEYFIDATSSMIDPCHRLAWWYNKGFRRLAVNYIQPALSLDSQACRSLTINVFSENNYLEGYILKEHLLRFYTLSVLKGEAPLENSSDTTALFEYLDNSTIPKVDIPISYFDQLRSLFYSSTSQHCPINKLYYKP